MKIQKKRTKTGIQKIFFYHMSVITVSVFLVAFIAVTLVMLHDSINVLKESRLDVLKQMDERNKILNHTMRFLADEIYDSCSQSLVNASPVEFNELKPSVFENMSHNNIILNKLNMYPSIIVMMKNGNSITSEDVTAEDLSQISSSYWYIGNITSPQESFWTTRYYISGQSANMQICFVKSILDSNGAYAGMIMVNVSTDYLKEAYMYMLGDGYRIYILDENGKAISHSYPALLGSYLYYMPYFWMNYPRNTSSLVRGNTSLLLHTNIYSPQTGWTIVEEIPLKNLTASFSSVLWIAGLLFIFCITLSVAASYFFSKKISRPIVAISKQMIEQECSHIDFQPAYKEVLALSTIYNLTVDKMHDLINQVEKKEREKREIELSFLQAQINPHFLHNTLFSVKCLIEMGHSSKASNMLANLVKLLKIPVSAHQEWTTVKNEISYLQNYMSLMQNRYEERNIRLEISADEESLSVILPRLLLQPIVENSIFHGFDDLNSGGIICASFQISNEKLIVRIIDNGKGMTPEELEGLWLEPADSSKTFHRIGLINIRHRIKLLYGEGYDITVVSEPGQGTETILILGCRKEESQNE